MALPDPNGTLINGKGMFVGEATVAEGAVSMTVPLPAKGAIYVTGGAIPSWNTICYGWLATESNFQLNFNVPAPPGGGTLNWWLIVIN